MATISGGMHSFRCEVKHAFFCPGWNRLTECSCFLHSVQDHSALLASTFDMFEFVLGQIQPPPPLYLVLCVLLLTLGNQPVVLCNHFFAADSCIELLVWCNLLMHALKCTTEYHYYMQVDFSFMHYMHHPSSASQLWMINSHEFWCIMPI